MDPRELLNAAADRQEILISYMPHWADKRQAIIILDWLREEAASIAWDFLAQPSQEWIESQPYIRMARLILGTVDGSEL